MATNRILLQNGCVITVDKELGNFRRADVLIEGTKIAAIGRDLEVADAEVIDASNTIVQMRAAFQCQRALVNQRALYGGSFEGEELLTVRDVLEFATIEGARTVGLAHKTGSLTPGKEADIIMLRTDRLNVVPLNDPVGAVVVGADTGNVDTVFVAWQALKRNGQLLNVDLERARELAVESRDYVVARSGFTLPAF
jgi:5-methylthioadenosine/S-adenosylhomocysteine deaminase